MKDEANRKSGVCISGGHTFTTTLARFACNSRGLHSRTVQDGDEARSGFLWGGSYGFVVWFWLRKPHTKRPLRYAHKYRISKNKKSLKTSSGQLDGVGGVKTRRYHPPTDLDNNKNITVFFVERSQIGVKICLAQGERNQGEILVYKI